ncbi:MAG TPA: thiamine pyrophosphate-dependent enzyme [Syntrophales bacterium]|jgi:pyruvate ferredoxin oxidoreductase beta subunit|nr:thiamine pyrophosphate-dependent enzyme [Syntrophales bacterium]HOU77683.1 thiamine pyrophosphate-dependent enzyme [Syntrophales bacterium]HPC32232.1 thiamine pyrophosphate-dependent enzyme [Syntrophales bacterium]HQI34932.1 thiamine pyrophosphate-dependent enzyme [Syntrophales bacterium]HRR46847.1 thiamine pyrophosphate-dependent enzyme [Syntrophales bacterium]
MPENLFKINAKEYILPGTRACQGCGLSLAYRYALKALRENTIVTLPASCLCVLHGIYPSTPVMIPCLNNSFASTAASASGLVAGLQAMNRTDITVMAIAGDGGTFDMGIQALSGAAERGTDFIYCCYDNEGYMNTGTQRSSATPLGALTTTTPIATKQQHKKDFIKIMEAHDIAYLATASPAYPIDLYDKFVKAKKIRGTRYLHLYIPCPPGWVFPPKDTVKMGRLAVETGVTPLFEIENGRFRFTGRSKSMAEKGNRLPVINYLEKQGRFRKMNIEQLQQMQRWVDGKWQEYQRRAQE